ncbi:MAG: hypothetical protein CSA70_03250 [Rhodobacterales bacterium]|nr:MAG: hypothetical protein CSA70_03250 [Rhodobacterales bacterium]
MITLYFALIAAFCGGGFLLWRARSRRALRRALLASPLEPGEREVIVEQVPLLKTLPEGLWPALEGKVNLFLDQVTFYGCNGVEVTEEMQLSIAAQACLLVLNTDQWYSHLTTILIYPGAFKSKQSRRNGFVVTEADEVRFGESWVRGPVILSWAASEQGALNPEDGHNVVLHEFAHQLDGLSGYTDGAPVLPDHTRFRSWERVVLESFDRHVMAVKQGRQTVIDPYGAQGHEEFFAVLVELFFERPDMLEQAEPALYQQLVDLFQLDPVTWS